MFYEGDFVEQSLTYSGLDAFAPYYGNYPACQPSQFQQNDYQFSDVPASIGDYNNSIVCQQNSRTAATNSITSMEAVPFGLQTFDDSPSTSTAQGQLESTPLTYGAGMRSFDVSPSTSTDQGHLESTALNYASGMRSFGVSPTSSTESSHLDAIPVFDSHEQPTANLSVTDSLSQQRNQSIIGVDLSDSSAQSLRKFSKDQRNSRKRKEFHLEGAESNYAAVSTLFSRFQAPLGVFEQSDTEDPAGTFLRKCSEMNNVTCMFCRGVVADPKFLVPHLKSHFNSSTNLTIEGMLGGMLQTIGEMGVLGVLPNEADRIAAVDRMKLNIGFWSSFYKNYDKKQGSEVIPTERQRKKRRFERTNSPPDELILPSSCVRTLSGQ